MFLQEEYRLKYSFKMQSIQTYITLRNLRFYAYHGVLPQERVVGGEYSVDVFLDVDKTQAAVLADSLEHTINYASVYELVDKEMKKSSLLLEHVAGRILQRLFLNFRCLNEAKVSVSKITPPINFFSGNVEVCLQSINPWREPIDLLILDFDGTLADTSAGIVATMQETFKEMFNNIVPTENEICQTIGLPLYKEFEKFLPSESTKDKILAYVKKYKEIFSTVGMSNTEAFPTVVETLKKISNQYPHIKKSIVTSREHKSLVALCEKLEIGNYIDYFVASDDVVNKKPNPEAVLNLLERTNTSIANVLVVGDTTYDIKMGKAAGCRTCGVTYGNHSAVQLANEGATLLINCFENILDVL